MLKAIYEHIWKALRDKLKKFYLLPLFNYKYYNKYYENNSCPRGEIGRHKGLKILAACGVPVRSGRGHHL